LHRERDEPSSIVLAGEAVKDGPQVGREQAVEDGDVIEPHS